MRLVIAPVLVMPGGTAMITKTKRLPATTQILNLFPINPQMFKYIVKAGPEESG